MTANPMTPRSAHPIPGYETLTAAERGALTRIKRAGGYGLWVRRGAETLSHLTLVERGLIWQSVADDPAFWKFDLSPSGERALSALPPIDEKPEAQA